MIPPHFGFRSYDDVAKEVHERESFVPCSVEYFVDDLRWPGDHGSIISDADGPIHDFRMFQEQTHQRVGRVIILDVQAEVPERSGVDQILGFAGEKLEKLSELLFPCGILQVFDDVELDVAFAQYVQRAP